MVKIVTIMIRVGATRVRKIPCVFWMKKHPIGFYEIIFQSKKEMIVYQGNDRCQLSDATATEMAISI